MILQKEYTFWQWQFSCNCQYLVMNYFKFYTVIFCRKPKQLIGAKNKWTNWLPKIFYYIKETHTTDRSVILVVILEMVMTLEHSNPFRCWEGHFPGQTLSNTDRFFFPFFFFFVFISMTRVTSTDILSNSIPMEKFCVSFEFKDSFLDQLGSSGNFLQISITKKKIVLLG